MRRLVCLLRGHRWSVGERRFIVVCTRCGWFRFWVACLECDAPIPGGNVCADCAQRLLGKAGGG